ncbi:FIVAR domain-containing protein, partial [Streptococcus pseudopneumoniae]|uniref:FIVAR domain-containing protein n=1 Tax=Streptococcus pseudopneumoniae TaxID=257758 RepID=UPI000534E555
AVDEALENAKRAVDNANDAAGVTSAQETGRQTIQDVPETGTAKSALNAELGKESGTKESDKYQNADQAKRTAYDEALKAAKAVDAKP